MTSHDIPQLESMLANHKVFLLVTIIMLDLCSCIFFSMGGAIAVHVGVQGLLGPSLSGLAVIDVVEGKNNLNPLRVISIKFLLVISMLCKTEWS